jgi:hypothetical protein
MCGDYHLVNKHTHSKKYAMLLAKEIFEYEHTNTCEKIMRYTHIIHGRNEVNGMYSWITK